jgi:hypothetical protein
MPKSIVITVPHDLGAEAAKKRVAEGVERMRREYVDKFAYSEVVWIEQTANLRVVAFGQTALAQIDVGHEQLRIEVRLPWILAGLTTTIQSVLTDRAQESLAIEHRPPKS